MSRKIVQVKKSELGDAIRTIRRSLGKTQAEMGKLVGVCEATIKFWEHGKHAPGARHLMYLERLIPDAETARIWGLSTLEDALLGKEEMDRPYNKDGPTQVPGRLPPVPTGKPIRKLTKQEKDDLLRQYSDSTEGIEAVYQMAALGHDGAAQVLAACAEKLTHAAGDWRQMKYSKK